MNLNELNGELNYFTEQIASETVKLNYAGIAIVWLFKPEGGFPAPLLISCGLFVGSLFVYLAFLFYSARKIHERFMEAEAEIDRDAAIPEAEKSTHDFGGWNPSIVRWKTRLRRAYFLLGVAGYCVMAYYVVANIILE